MNDKRPLGALAVVAVLTVVILVSWAGMYILSLIR